MIGRGIFHDPFCFQNEAQASELFSQTSEEASSAHADVSRGVSEETTQARSVTSANKQASQYHSETSETPSTAADGRGVSRDDTATRNLQLFKLLNLHLDLYDQWQEQLGRPYDTLKRFYKIYVRDFDGAAETRDKLMHSKTTDEARQIIADVVGDANQLH